MSLVDAFPLVLQEMRKKRGLSQERLGLKSGVHRTFIGKMERGEKAPTIATLERLAGALKLRPSQLLAMAERKSKS